MSDPDRTNTDSDTEFVPNLIPTPPNPLVPFITEADTIAPTPEPYQHDWQGMTVSAFNQEWQPVLRKNPLYEPAKDGKKWCTLKISTKECFTHCDYCLAKESIAQIEVCSTDYKHAMIQLCKGCYYKYVPEHLWDKTNLSQYANCMFEMPFNETLKLNAPATFSLRYIYYKRDIDTWDHEVLHREMDSNPQSWFKLPMYIKAIDLVTHDVGG
jgi:hypothetical protein